MGRIEAATVPLRTVVHSGAIHSLHPVIPTDVRSSGRLLPIQESMRNPTAPTVATASAPGPPIPSSSVFPIAGSLGGSAVRVGVISDPGRSHSLGFHLGRGFALAGTLHGVGHKFGRDLDVVLVERALDRES